MRRRPLGRTAVELTELGLGGAAFGNLYQEIREQDVAATVDAAWAAGVRYFDTAPSYGNGLSEARLGAALRAYDRRDYVLSTKVGYALDMPEQTEPGQSIFKGTRFLPRSDFTKDAVERSFHESLGRLGVDRVDIVWMHDPDEAASIFPNAPGARSHFEDAMNEAYPFLHELRAQGVIGAIGVGMNQWEMLEDFARVGDFDSFLLAGRYTLLEQSALESFLPMCVEREIGVVIGGPFASGILATGPVDGARYNYARAGDDVLDRVRQMAEVCARHEVPLPAVALQFPLAHPAVASVIPGARSASEAAANDGYAQVALGEALWAELRDRGLISLTAPVPVSVTCRSRRL